MFSDQSPPHYAILVILPLPLSSLLNLPSVSMTFCTVLWSTAFWKDAVRACLAWGDLHKGTVAVPAPLRTVAPFAAATINCQ